MKRLFSILKWGGIGLVVLIALFVAAVFALQNRSFDAPYPNIAASTDSAVIARGKHLVYGPAHCNYCHIAPSDVPKVLKGEFVELKGGYEFKLPLGVIRSKNITPDNETGIGLRTDAELARILRYGTYPDGKAVFDFMPFHNMSDEDLTAVISFLRSQAPVRNEVVNREMNFAGKAVMAFLIEPVHPVAEPPKETTIDSTSTYGKYLANSVANCRGCHTNRDLMTGAFVGPEYAGGFAMPSEEDPNIIITSPNISPDPETGHMATWSEEVFIHRFRQGPKVAGSPMPWGAFKNMTDLELKAIYRFLQSVEPVHNKIEKIVAEAKE